MYLFVCCLYGGLHIVSTNDNTRCIEKMIHQYLSHHMGKPTICICENKCADQLRGNRKADQRLCFRYSDSTIPPLRNPKISSF